MSEFHCPNPSCNTTKNQHFVGEAFNHNTFTIEGHFRCLTCLCEYTEKDSGRVVITKAGLNAKQVHDARHQFFIEMVAAELEKERASVV